MKQIDFGGIAPSIDPASLPDNAGQVAVNCDLRFGDLRPWAGLGGAVVTFPAARKSVYRFGQQVDVAANDTVYWFSAADDTDFAKGFTLGDVSERTYITPEAGGLFVTDFTAATTGGAGQTYPYNRYSLAINPPADWNSSGGTVNTVTFTPGTAIERAYIQTFVTAFGEESPPSLPIFLTIASGATATFGNLQQPPGAGFNFGAGGKRRIYRTVVGTNRTVNYQLAAELPVATATFADTVADVDLGISCASINWSPPPATMRGIVAHPGQFMVGFDGQDVCPSEVGKPHAYPIAYRLTAEWEVVGLAVFGSTILVATKGSPMLVIGTAPASLVPRKLDGDYPCVSKRSIVSTGSTALYASSEGLINVSTGGAQNITETILSPSEWRKLRPQTMMGVMWEGRYVGFFDTGTANNPEWIPAQKGAIVFDPSNASAPLSMLDVHADGAYVEPQNGRLYLSRAGALQRFNEGAPLTFRWKSKLFRGPFATPTAARVTSSVYPVNFKFFAGAVEKLVKAVGADRFFRLPGGYKARGFEYEVSGTGRIPEVTVGSIGER